MLTVKDKIEQFKRDCKSNEYYTKMIIDCNERLEVINHNLQGVKSITPKGVVYENAGNPYKEGKLHWLYLEEEVIKERNEYIRRVNVINDKLAKIDDPVDRQMVIDLYINKKNHQDTAEKYHYANRMSLYKHINKILAEIM